MTKKNTQINPQDLTISELRAITVEQFQAQTPETQVQLFQKALDMLNSLASPQDRKGQVIAVLRDNPLTLAEVAEHLNINSRNVSTIMTALKKDGWSFLTDDYGRKILRGKIEDDKLIPIDQIG